MGVVQWSPAESVVLEGGGEADEVGKFGEAAAVAGGDDLPVFRWVMERSKARGGVAMPRLRDSVWGGGRGRVVCGGVG